MTNASEEVTAITSPPNSRSEEEAEMIMMMMPSGASCEAPPMHYSSSTSCDPEQRCIEANEMAITSAAGNAAKAARMGLRRTFNNNNTNLRISNTSPEAVEHDKDITATESVDRDTAKVHNGFESDDDEEKNESTTTLNTTTVSSSDDDDDDDGLFNEEEDGAYKTCSSATLSQSVHIIQPEEQPKALIATIGLFLVQTWNWLHYFFVTIILLNLFNAKKQIIAKESGSKIEVVHNFCGGGSVQGGETETEFFKSDTKIVQESSSPTSPVGNMSPNTCSIQNQEETVEKAEEAIIMAATTTTIDVAAQEKLEAAVVQEQQQQQQSPQIQIILSEVPEKPSEKEDENEDDDDVDEGVEEGEEVVVEMGVALARRDSVDSYTSSEGSGNLGDAEEDNISCDKSSTSEENDSNINTMINNNTSSNNDEELGKPLAQKIVSQVESMFSDEHLSKDGFLLKHVRRRSDGFVSLKLVAGLRKVKQISRDFPQVLDALRISTKLEINPEGTKIRRAEPLSAFLKAVPIKAKEKGPGKDKENQGSSNDENQQPPTSINQQNNKTASRNLDNARNGNNQNGNRRNSAQNNANNNNGGSQSRRNSSAYNQTHRKSSNTSTSSNNSSRHNSFSKPPLSSSSHPADLLRNVYSSVVAYSSSGEESQSPQVGRRRGGSLPIAALQRSSGAAYLSPNSSPPGCNGAFITIGPNGARPKSNSYCEGASPTTMSPWLQRRKASASSRLSSGELTFSGVVRQPRGPDGTKGFASGYRAMILEERLQQQTNSAVSA